MEKTSNKPHIVITTTLISEKLIILQLDKCTRTMFNIEI